MDKEGAAPDRVKKREAEEVSSLFSWFRGEAVCHSGVCARARWGSGNAPPRPPAQRHPLVKRGRVWCLETSLEQRQMNERKCQTVRPIPTPLAHVSWERSAGSISWTCPQLTRGDYPKSTPLPRSCPNIDLSVQRAYRPNLSLQLGQQGKAILASEQPVELTEAHGCTEVQQLTFALSPAFFRSSQKHLPLTLCLPISSQSASQCQKLKGLKSLPES